MAAVKSQVEYYFSRANLQNDTYLVSQMDSQMFVPLDVIFGFKGVQKLTLDLDVVLQAITGSTELKVDQTGPYVKIRPNVTSERNMLILREIPSATAEDTVKGLFGEYAAEIESIKSEIGDNWYVRFKSEKAALAAHEQLSAQTFGEPPQPIRARIKSESVLRSFIQAGQADGQAPPQFGGKGKGGGKGYKGGGKGFYQPQMPAQGPNMYYSDAIDPNMAQPPQFQAGGFNPYAMNYGGPGQAFQPYGGGPSPQGVVPGGMPGAEGIKGKKKKKAKGKEGDQKAGGPPAPKQAAGPEKLMAGGKNAQDASLDLGADMFPALPGSPGTESSKKGYTSQFKAYQPAEIAAIVKKLGEEAAGGKLQAPESLPRESPYLAKAAQAEMETVDISSGTAKSA